MIGAIFIFSCTADKSVQDDSQRQLGTGRYQQPISCNHAIKSQIAKLFGTAVMPLD